MLLNTNVFAVTAVSATHGTGYVGAIELMVAQNCYFGRQAGYSNATGNFNAFFGEQAGNATTGASNTFIGRNAGYLVTSGAKNVIIGAYAGNTAPISATGSNNIVFSDGDANVRGIFDSSGRFLVGLTSNSASANGSLFQVSSSPATWCSYFENSQATAGNCFGLQIKYLNAAPNGTGNEMIYCVDNTALRMAVRSNGGIANYTANNVVLSDKREKINFAPSKSYLDVICAIPVQTFNYIDQNLETDAGLTLGVTAQDVQAVAPELVTEGNWGSKDQPKMRLEIYQTDLQYALMKALQELKAEFDAYKATHP